MTVSPHLALRFGVRFNPTPEEAISLYLRRWAVSKPLPDTAGIVYEAEVYKFEPNDLAAAFPPLPKTENRFFFTTCKRQKAGRGYRMSRTTGAGGWVSNGKKMVKNTAGKTIGYQETLRYKYKDKSRDSEWLMEEYHYQLDGSAVVGGDQERVFCRLYAKTGSIKLQKSAAASGDRRLDLGMQEPGSTMAAVAVQPRRQEPVTPVLPAMTQPQAIKNPPLQPCVTVPTPVAITLARAPKRPAPQVSGPPRPKKMLVAAALPALEVPVPPAGPRPIVVGYNSPKAPAWYTAAMVTRKSSRSPFADPPPPAAEATPVEEDHRIIQEEARDGDEDDDWLDHMLEFELEVEPQKEHDKIQDEASGGDDENDWRDHMLMLESELEVEPQKEHAKIQDEEEGQHQHATSLDGLVVDERGDDVVAQDLFDGLKDIDDPIDGEDEDWLSRPISDYNDTLPF